MSKDKIKKFNKRKLEDLDKLERILTVGSPRFGANINELVKESDDSNEYKDNLIFYLTESIKALDRLLRAQKEDPIIVIKDLYDNTKYDKKIDKAYYRGKKQAYEELLKRMNRGSKYD